MRIPYELKELEGYLRDEPYDRETLEYIHPEWTKIEAWKKMGETVSRGELARFIMAHQTPKDWIYTGFLIEYFGIVCGIHDIPIISEQYSSFNEKAFWIYSIAMTIKNWYPNEVFECIENITDHGKIYDFKIHIKWIDILIDINSFDEEKYKTGFNYVSFDVSSFENLKNAECTIFDMSEEIQFNFENLRSLLVREIGPPMPAYGEDSEFYQVPSDDESPKDEYF